MKMKRANEMVANDYGIMIKRCCASCANRDFDDQELRCCQLTGLKCLGCERGKVQRRAYQLSMIEVRTSELNAKVRDVEPASVESIRRDFEVKHGSRFLIE